MLKKPSPINKLLDFGIIEKEDHDRHLREIENNIEELRDNVAEKEKKAQSMLDKLKNNPEQLQTFWQLHGSLFRLA